MKLTKKEMNAVVGGDGFCTCKFEPTKTTCACGIEFEVSSMLDLAQSLQDCRNKCCNTPNVYGTRPLGLTYKEADTNEEEVHIPC